MNFIKRVLAAIFDFLQGIVVVLAIMVMIYLFIMSPQEINGQSMFPTFYNGEYILTNKVEYKLHSPIRGDIVIFKSPRNKDIDYIKRIIGLPGERIKLENNKYFINDKQLTEAYIGTEVTTFGGSYLQEGVEVSIPEGKYFVSGDNRPHSSDSREFGPIPAEDIIGKALLRYWPFDRAGIISNPSYN